MKSTVDPWGRVIVDISAVEDLLYSGLKIDDILVEPGPLADQFNEMCKLRDRMQYVARTPEPIDHSPEEEHTRRASEWLICRDLNDLDVRSFVLSLCKTDAQCARVNMEMDLYEDRDLLPLLRTMICLVDHFRTNKIVWGVGRGSSVASYVLFLIGVHKIDSLKYDLDIKEFLKD